MIREIKHRIFLEAKKDLGLRNIDIVKKTGKSEQRISNYLKNKESIPDDFLDTFSKVFNVDLEKYKSKDNSYNYLAPMPNILQEPPIEFLTKPIDQMNENEQLKKEVKYLTLLLDIITVENEALKKNLQTEPKS